MTRQSLSLPATLRPFLVHRAALLIAVAPALAGIGCSLKHTALVSVADAVSGSGGAYGSDDDPELVRAAVPFGLKTMEGLALSLPDHVPLRAAMAKGFTQYGYAFVQTDADAVADKDPERAKALKARATKLYLRARDHGLEGLKLRHGLQAAELRGLTRVEALKKVEKQDVELLYWTLVPWAAAIALNKTDVSLVGDLGAVAAMLDRAIELDEPYDQGALHEFSLSFDAARAGGTTRVKQKAHLDRALQLSGGHRLSPSVSWAENVLVQAQDKKGFEAELQRVLKFDLNAPASREDRLANTLAQQRARWLLSRVSDLFLDES